MEEEKDEEEEERERRGAWREEEPALGAVELRVEVAAVAVVVALHPRPRAPKPQVAVHLIAALRLHSQLLPLHPVPARCSPPEFVSAAIALANPPTRRKHQEMRRDAVGVGTVRECGENFVEALVVSIAPERIRSHPDSTPASCAA